MTLHWHSYKFVGQTWNMDLLGSFFERRSLTVCKRVVKYAFEEPEANRMDILTLHDIRQGIKDLKKFQVRYYLDPAVAKLQDKLIKLLDYLRSMEEKYYA